MLHGWNRAVRVETDEMARDGGAALGVLGRSWAPATCPTSWSTMATETPAGLPVGAYVHLEHDHNTGRPELRITADYGDGFDRLAALPVYLDRGTVARAADDMLAVTRATAAGARGADVTALPGAPLTDPVTAIVSGVLPLALVVADPHAVHVNPDDPRRSLRARRCGHMSDGSASPRPPCGPTDTAGPD